MPNLHQPSRNESIPPRKQKILILGGTGFLGPALIESILARGHELTLFTSGGTEGRRRATGRPSLIPDGVEVSLGNRDPDRTADDRRLEGDPDAEEKRDPNSSRGLDSLAGRFFDAVIDTSGYFPRMVKASAKALVSNVEQYVFISTVSVYKDNSLPDATEGSELHTLDDPTCEEFGEHFQNYGGGKALCEAAVAVAFSGRATVIRPGFIVGPGDTSARFMYWPWRVSKGGEMLVPGSPSDPVQVIDVRDLADWTVHCIECRTYGTFNATGPRSPLSMEEMLEGCSSGVEVACKPVWADPGFLQEHGLAYPIWAAPEGDTAGFHRTNIDRAVSAGLTFRPMADTAKASLEWFNALDEQQQKRFVPTQLADAERAGLKAWRAR